MDYQTIEIKNTGTLSFDRMDVGESTKDGKIPSTSSFEYIEGSQNSAYIAKSNRLK